MLSKTMEKALNGQINAELYSSYMYLAMSAWFTGNGMAGFANWMRQQAQEEMFHAIKFYDFVGGRGGKVALAAIAKPPGDWKNAIELFQATLEHEQKVTGLIHQLYETAVKAKDYPTQVMLHWFINEQVEEEKNASAIVEQLRMMDAHLGNIIHIDRHVGKRDED